MISAKAKRAEVLKWTTERLKVEKRLDDGWQPVHTTRGGAVLYGLVEGGKVATVALGGKALRKYLARRVSSEGIHLPVTGPGTAEQPTGGGPSEGECAQKFWNCAFGVKNDFWDTIWETVRFAKNLAEGDLNEIDDQMDDARSKLRRCMGDKCADMLGID